MNITKYARITALDLNELPIQTIEGKITNAGTLNLDGKSALRRSCQFSITCETNEQPIDEYWSLKTLFSLSLGIAEDNQEPEWYDQGVFCLTSLVFLKILIA